jgi:putative flippase GtrA
VRRAGTAIALTTYLLIGGLGAVAYVIIGTFLTDGVGLAASVSSLVAYAVLIPILYLLQRVVTFRPERVLGRMFWRYVAVQVAALLASSAVVGILVSVFGIAALPAFTATALVIGVASYLVHRTWTFSTRVQGETG